MISKTLDFSVLWTSSVRLPCVIDHLSEYVGRPLEGNVWRNDNSLCVFKCHSGWHQDKWISEVYQKRGDVEGSLGCLPGWQSPDCVHTDGFRRKQPFREPASQAVASAFVGLGGLNSRRSFWHITWKDRVKNEFRSEKDNPKKSIWNTLKSSHLQTPVVSCEWVESRAYMPKAAAQWRPRFSHEKG